MKFKVGEEDEGEKHLWGKNLDRPNPHQNCRVLAGRRVKDKFGGDMFFFHLDINHIRTASFYKAFSLA